MNAAIKTLEYNLVIIEEQIAGADSFIASRRKEIGARKANLKTLYKDRNETMMAIERLRRAR